MDDDSRTATAPVDGHAVPWDDFWAFFADRQDDDAPFLTELDHANRTCRRWTVGAWKQRVGATADWLLRTGLTPGTVVATLAGNSADALGLAYGCWISGLCYLPLNPHDSDHRHAYILEDAGARLLVTSEVHRAAGDALRHRTGVDHRHCADFPVDFTGSLASVRGTSASLDAAVLLVYTSGTTGNPKGVRLSAQNLLLDVEALSRRLGWGDRDSVLTVLPIHHVNGLVISSLLPWSVGMRTVLCDRFRSEQFWADAAAHQTTVCSMVPTLLEFLTAGPDDVPSTPLREVLCGAGPLHVATVARFEARFRVPVRHIYGLSETTAVVCATPPLAEAERTAWHQDRGVPSVGPALDHTTVAVMERDGSSLQGPDAAGELVVRGGILMEGYLGLPEETRSAFRDGWFHTGDEGFWTPDAAGVPWFFVTGRLKELIIRGGVNLSPVEIDEVLNAHPGIRIGLAVAFPHRLYGEEVAAYVVPDGPLTADDVIEHCAQHLDHAMCPKIVVFGTEVPYTATGKPKRLELGGLLGPSLARYAESDFRRTPRSKST